MQPCFANDAAVVIASFSKFPIQADRSPAPNSSTAPSKDAIIRPATPLPDDHINTPITPAAASLPTAAPELSPLFATNVPRPTRRTTVPSSTNALNARRTVW